MRTCQAMGRKYTSRSRVAVAVAEPGRWTVRASSFSSRSVGDYSLSLDAADLVFEDSLGTGDQRQKDGQYLDTYVFQGAAGDDVRIHLVGAFDTVLMLFDSNGDLVAENDDYEVGTLGYSAIVEVLQSTGEYRVMVTSYEVGETGDYTLIVRSGRREAAMNRAGASDSAAPGLVQQAPEREWITHEWITGEYRSDDRRRGGLDYGYQYASYRGSTVVVSVTCFNRELPAEVYAERGQEPGIQASVRPLPGELVPLEGELYVKTRQYLARRVGQTYDPEDNDGLGSIELPVETVHAEWDGGRHSTSHEAIETLDDWLFSDGTLKSPREFVRDLRRRRVVRLTVELPLIGETVSEVVSLRGSNRAISQLPCVP